MVDGLTWMRVAPPICHPHDSTVLVKIEAPQEDAVKVLRSMHLEGTLCQSLPEDVLSRGDEYDKLSGFFLMQD